jgi:nucleoside-diphosphate-sugar epimerase
MVSFVNVLLTGGTGYIGGTVLRTLREHGHQVRAVVRGEESARTVSEAGAEAVVGDVTDVPWLTTQLSDVDGAIHLASLEPAGDDAVLDAVFTAFQGTAKPFVYTSGVWVWGDNAAITEDSPARPTDVSVWRVPRHERVLTSGLRASIVAPAPVYGHGKGLAAWLFSYGPRTDDGALRMVGSGAQHWASVHVEDLADLYVAVLERAPGGGLYIGASGVNPTVREMAQAAVGPDGTVAPEDDDATRARLGAGLADALLLDQQAGGSLARAQLGWQPSRPSVLDELAAR